MGIGCDEALGTVICHIYQRVLLRHICGALTEVQESPSGDTWEVKSISEQKPPTPTSFRNSDPAVHPKLLSLKISTCPGPAGTSQGPQPAWLWVCLTAPSPHVGTPTPPHSQVQDPAQRCTPERPFTLLLPLEIAWACPTLPLAISHSSSGLSLITRDRSPY